MSTPIELLNQGIDALQKGQYDAAIDSLEKFCNHPTESELKLHFKGHQSLIQAYIKVGNFEQAIKQCRKLEAHEHPKLQEWATQTIPKIQQIAKQRSDVDQSHADISEELKQAIKAFRREDYAQTIRRLEALREHLDSESSHYSRAQMTLAKAYREAGKREEAIALGRAMVVGDRNDLRIWGRRFLETLSAEPEAVDLVPQTAPQTTTSARTTTRTASAHPSPQSQGYSTTLTRRSPTPVPVQQPGRDYTSPILSALCHASPTFILTIILYMSVPCELAFIMDIPRFLIPVVICCTTQDPVVKINAREAINYAITVMIVSFFILIGLIIGVIGFFQFRWAFLPVFLVALIPISLYSTMLSLWPIMGTFACLANPGKTFHYPRWLVGHYLR